LIERLREGSDPIESQELRHAIALARAPAPTPYKRCNTEE